MKTILQNILLIFKNPKYLISYLIIIVTLTILWWNFTDFQLIYGNYWPNRFWIDNIISAINIIIFPLFILAWIYRAYTLGSYSNKSESLGFLGWLLGILISGSLCCGSSLLLAVGASFFTNFFSKNLPYGGMELKILGVTILLFATISLFKNLLVCHTKLKKTIKNNINDQ